MNKQQLKATIIKAFSGVKLGGGIGLLQAQAIDDYETKEIQKRQRLKDQKEDWSKLSTDDLFMYESSLSFFDAEGMRFHLPAFLLAQIDDISNHSVMFHLTSLDEYSISRFVLLNESQRTTILDFLNWCLSNVDYKDDHPDIERAINEYWYKTN